MFIDHVGAEQLDAGARHMKVCGRILSHGAIGEMDAMVTGSVRGVKEYARIPARELTFGGMPMYNQIDKRPEATRALSAKLSSGELKSAEAVVRGGLEKWAECVDRVYGSQTFGRRILALDGAR